MAGNAISMLPTPVDNSFESYRQSIVFEVGVGVIIGICIGLGLLAYSYPPFQAIVTGRPHTPDAEEKSSDEGTTETTVAGLTTPGSLSVAPLDSTALLTAYKSRYELEFQELGGIGDDDFLGKGGFGTVVRARNVWDDKVYAIKKVTKSGACTSSDIELVLREVKLLAKLDHPNIVRYYNSWVEEHEVPLGTHSEDSENLDGSLTLSRTSSVSTDGQREHTNSIGSASNILADYADLYQPQPLLNDFGFDFAEGSQTQHLSKTTSSETDDSRTLSQTGHSSEGISAGEASENGEAQKSIPAENTTKRVTLYIQMQLCAGSLESWLESRRTVDLKANMTIFQQIVAGLCHVHSHGLIHRDLKVCKVSLKSTFWTSIT